MTGADVLAIDAALQCERGLKHDLERADDGSRSVLERADSCWKCRRCRETFQVRNQQGHKSVEIGTTFTMNGLLWILLSRTPSASVGSGAVASSFTAMYGAGAYTLVFRRLSPAEATIAKVMES